MGAVTIQQMADRIEALLEERLRIRGQGLAARLKAARRMLPRAVRDAGMRLALAAERAQHPRLLAQIDDARVAADYDLCLRHLSGLGRRDRRMAWLLDTAASVLVILLAVGLLMLGVLRWRGFL
jgi:hypothetical protein